MAEQYYDILIKNGAIYDGTLAEPITTDVGIIGDKIARVGTIAGEADRIIDAGGFAVTPGFIDVHTHCDSPFMLSAQFLKTAPMVPSVKGNWNYLYQGVTTVVSGNCGSGFADPSQWLDTVNAIGFGTNVFHLVPHGQIRTEVLGADQPAEPTESQLDALRNKVAEEMEKGAVGLSTGLIYFPGFITKTKEIIELAKVAARYGGLYASHIRDESGRPNARGEIGVVDSVKEAIEVGRRAELPVNISHLKIIGPPRNVDARLILDIIEQARSEGLAVTADQYPYDASSTHLHSILPDEFVGVGGVKEQFKTGEGRKNLQKALAEVLAVTTPDRILISEHRKNRRLEGKSLAEIARVQKQTPEETALEMLCQPAAPLAVFFSQSMDVVRQIMAQDYILTGSDGWTTHKDRLKPHPRCYGTFPRKIRQFALEEKIIGLPFAIRSMTSLPAETFHLKGRGRIEEGCFADVAVLDMDRFRDRADFADPHQYADGVEFLLVNGVLAIERGRATGHSGGRGLRRN